LIRRVWTSGEPVWIADVSREPEFLRASMALKAGLHGAFAFPIQTGAELYGVMEFYIRDVRQPDPALLRATRSIGFQIGQFVARKTAEEQIRRLAHFDPLTGLANRSLFNQILAHGLTKAERGGTSLAVLFIDLDGFKQINDSLGHDAGDSLLATFAQRLRDCLRKSDVTARLDGPDAAARLGGDEFVVLIDDFAEPSALAIVAQRIFSAAALPVTLNGREGRVTASVGISVYPRDGRDIDSLTKCADSAMYWAKQSGKNNYRFFAATGQPG
jgi:diguanylate cyclase (GGDEF)-like protein